MSLFRKAFGKKTPEEIRKSNEWLARAMISDMAEFIKENGAMPYTDYAKVFDRYCELTNDLPGFVHVPTFNDWVRVKKSSIIENENDEDEGDYYV